MEAKRSRKAYWWWYKTYGDKRRDSRCCWRSPLLYEAWLEQRVFSKFFFLTLIFSYSFVEFPKPSKFLRFSRLVSPSSGFCLEYFTLRQKKFFWMNVMKESVWSEQTKFGVILKYATGYLWKNWMNCGMKLLKREIYRNCTLKAKVRK